MNNIYFYQTQLGEIGIAENGEAITEFCFGRKEKYGYKEFESELIKEAYNQLQQFIAGSRQDFDLPLAPKGTEFQLKVWKALQQIPYGETCSYKDIAEKIGNIKACRAVGMANNRNPIPVFIPCHRVIGANGTLVGYGGGLHIKKKLLKIENNRISRDR